ncbi:hypothetical protein NSMS1_24590 [Nostoc sp. MS1]|nr:hypothetical protein NSMS1_24590 [Nostoc sp. MS1]
MSAYQSELGSNSQLELEADVLVIGGGPSVTWAAWNAASNGAKVILVDKGYCGTSGATAPSGTGVWCHQNPNNGKPQWLAEKH